MSLRRRLLVTLVASLGLLWLVASAWLLFDLNRSVRDTLDQRLVASAQMVAGLLSQVPRGTWQQTLDSRLASPPGAGVACQIRSMRGDFGGVLKNAPPGFAERSRRALPGGGAAWRACCICLLKGPAA